MKNKILVSIVSIVLIATFQIPCIRASEPMPDLVVVSIWKEGDMIWYQLRNVGDAVVPDGHHTFLFVDGDYMGRDLVYRALTPGERYTGCYVYEETPPEDRVVVWVDYYDVVVESSESNNRMEKIFGCDVTSPEIVSGPTVQDLTQTSAIILWETDENSDSLVKYGRGAGLFELEKAYDTSVRSHSITLAELEPSSTYHFVVQSTDPEGNSVQSEDKIFETLPLADGEDPVLSIVDPGVCKGLVTIFAKASDNRGIDRVEFFIDNEHVYTDYSASSDFNFKWNTEFFANGQHLLDALAYDISGRSSQLERWVLVDNEKDPTAPEVTIGYPANDEVVADEIGIVAFVKDDNGISRVQCLIDGKPFQTYTYEPTLPKYLSFTQPTTAIWWDTHGWPDGRRSIAVNATDVDGKWHLAYVYVIVNNGAPTPPHGLAVKNHEVWRHGNEFVIELTVECTATTGVTNIKIDEFLMRFQPISKKTNLANYVANFNVEKKVWTCNITCDYIPSGSSRTYTYSAVPVMVYPEAPMPSIGDAIKLSYHNVYTGTQETYETEAKQVAYDEDAGNQKPITIAYNNALQEADYLIVTNPTGLEQGFYGSSKESNDKLFSDMAELAFWHHSAILGFLYPFGLFSTGEDMRQNLTSLIKADPPGLWASKLHPNFCKPLGGYLLIVGEADIVPAWEMTLDVPIPLSDYYYSTRGGEAPDLIVGRIIGPTAANLSKPIQTSIGVLKWQHGVGSGVYSFDRSDALLISGNGGDQDLFAQTLNNAVSTFSSQGFKNVAQLHWKDYSGADMVQEFKTQAQNKDVIWFFGHANPTQWIPVPTTETVKFMDFGNVKPFVVAATCNTGNYEKGNIALAFLERGTAVYIGATAGSLPNPNTLFSSFFKSWDASESIGKAFTELKKNNLGYANYQRWLFEYNLYGDPKFGITQSLSGGRSAFEPELLSSAPTMLQVEVPDYIVDRDFYGEGLDYVHIPDGLVWFEKGQLQVPFYSISINYPKGYEINKVMLNQKSGLVMDQDLNIPMTPLDITFGIFNSVAYSGTVEGWFPERDYAWRTLENSDGTKTLIITMFPFYYNPLTNMVRFYKNYSFDIDYTVSQVAVTKLSTQRYAYQPGDIVTFDIEFDNRDQPQDVTIQALIKKYDQETIADGLLLRTLKNCAGLCSFSPRWDTSTFDSGYYYVQVTLTDPLGNLLDRKTEMFRLGRSSGAVTCLTATPRRFHIGDAVEVNMEFSNIGTIPVSGVAKIEVLNSLRTIVDEFQHDIAYLLPSESISLSNTWDASEVEEGSYNIVGYVLYDGKACRPMIITVETDYAPPFINVQAPLEGQALQDGVTLKASVSDPSGVDWVTFSIRESDGTVIDPAFESMSPTYVGGDMWQLLFNTNQPRLPDGYYLFIANASDMVGNEGSATAQFSICNWACLKLLPATPNSKAGRTMPVKFSLRVAASADSAQPFVWNEELIVKIYRKGYPGTVLQTSTYGTTSTDYRIDPIGEKYITNFKTLSTSATYVVEIYRKGILIGSLEFKTVK